MLIIKDQMGVTLSAVASVTSGSLTYAVTSGSLPGSVSLNSSTGAITGDFDAVGSDTLPHSQLLN